MIPFDGQFAENTMLPLAIAAYDSKNPPAGYVIGQSAFEIIADTTHPDYQVQFNRSSPQHKNMMQSMIHQPDQSRGTTSQMDVAALQANPNPNLHFGWLCLDDAKQRIIIAFRGTELLHEWINNFDFIPSPYAPIPGRGTVHQGFQLVYYSVRANLRSLVKQYAPARKNLLITGHSLGAALCALATPDLLNDIASNLAPMVYTWAEPRVGHDDFVSFYDTHVNVCYRITNVWDVVPHLPPDLAGYEHEGSQVTIDSGFSLDVVHNHVLKTGYVPGIARWNHDHPPQPTRHLGRMAVSALVGPVS